MVHSGSELLPRATVFARHHQVQVLEGSLARNVNNVVKRPLLIVLVCCFALLAFWYFSGNVGDRNQAHRDPGKETQAATGSAAVQNPAAAASATTPQAHTQVQNPSEDLWQRFLNRIGFTSRPWKSDISQPNRQVHPGEAKQMAGEEGNRLPPSIRGKVLDEEGRPVAWMGISADSLRLFGMPQGALGNSVAAQATSNETGVYQFEHLPEGEYRIRTMATALYQPAEITVRTGVEAADLIVSGERQVSIRGTVKDIKGKPLQGVRVVYEGEPSLEASTEEDGGYGFDISVTRSDRNSLLRFTLTGFRDETRQLNERDIYGRKEVLVNASLTPVKSLVIVAGKVSNREGVPLTGEIVHLIGQTSYRGVTNYAGEFVIPDVEGRQSYRLNVPSLSPYRPYVKEVLVGSNDVDLDIVMERGAADSATLSGRMLDAAGNPLPRFSLWLQSYNPEARGPVQVTSDDWGRYVVDGVPLGTLSLVTQSQPKIIVRGINLPEGGAQNVDIILDWGAYEVYGQVVDSRGLPVPASKIVLSWTYQYNGLRSQSERTTVADSDGFFRFTQVGPGVHSISLHDPTLRSAQIEYRVGQDTGPVVVQVAKDAQTVLLK
jgi:protocatechuate 3,4-dioxygenase beta subunit